MAIQLRVAASLDLLSNELIEDLSAENPGVFDKQWVVTQTDGVNNWLKHQLAHRTGIAANLQFTGINDMLQLLYYWISPDDKILIDKNRMTWAIYPELVEPNFCVRFPAIAAYYKDNESRRAALAAEMADLFDQYQVYRHNKIAEWKNDETKGEEWQMYLWKKMKARLGDNYADRLDVSVRLLEKLKDTESKKLIADRLPALRFFGIAIVTPYYLELFRVLSSIININFYLINPCPHILWMDDISNRKIAFLRQKEDLLEKLNIGNELLINWGKVLQESFQLILEHENYVNLYEVIEEDISASSNTLLKQIQYDIKNNIADADRSQIDETILYDESIQITGCYTPVREVEVLYNYLIDAFKADPTLGSRDVLVMTSDIDKYAHYIRAVFDNAPIAIPYTIVDESVASGNTVFTALTDILSINPDTFKSEEVLTLLDSPFIRRRFGFSEITDVRQAVREASIYFGTTAQTNDPIFDQTEAWMVSWDYGLEKIIYGLCISGEAEYTHGRYPLYPLDTAEGASMADRVRLFHFIQVLKSVLAERKESKSLSSWSVYLGDVMKEMILDEDEENEDYPLFAQMMETIALMDDFMNGEKISFITFRQIFLNRLQSEKRSKHFSGKGIGFCSLVPMRSVPYKIICLLGMNFDSFPRQDSALSFSLIGKKPRPGDRSVRENDKHLFLETLLAAKDRLYISYIARNVEKGGEMPPSTLVDELIDYIALKAPDYDQFKKSKIKIHPLHLFSSKYRNPKSLLPPNYLGNTLVKGKTLSMKEEQDKIIADLTEVPLDRFAAFFKNPIKDFFNKQLGIYYNDGEEYIPETEIFELNNLQKWKINDTLLRNEVQLDTFISQMKKAGQLPLANMGIAITQDLYEEISDFIKVFKNCKNNHEPRLVGINYKTSSMAITGNIEVYGDYYIFCVFSSSTLKWIMDPWVRYLIAIAHENSEPLGLHFIYKEKNAPMIFTVEPGKISRDEAIKHIEYMAKSFVEGQKTIFPFFPTLAYYYFSMKKDKTVMLNLEKNNLYSEYEKEKEQDFSKVFTDSEYIDKVIEEAETDVGFFSEESVKQIATNIKNIMTPIYNIDKNIFKK